MMTNWNSEASKILRLELVKRDISYKRLALLLERIGVDETERSIANKLSRGTFSFVFFLKCMKAIGYPKVDINLSSFNIHLDNS